jgi:DNA-binding transcriptional MerR regulator
MGGGLASEALTLDQLAAAVGISAENIKLYHAWCLLHEPRRRRGRSGDDAYYQDHVDRLKFIARALAHGFAFDDIRSLVDPDFLTCGDVYRVAEKRLQNLKQLLGPEAAAVVALEGLLARCARTGGRKDCVILAALSTESDAAASAPFRAAGRYPRKRRSAFALRGPSARRRLDPE